MKKMRIFALFSALVLMLTQLSGCGISVEAADLTKGMLAAPVKPVSLDESFLRGQTELSLKLFQEVTKEEIENVLISPLSISLALAMTANGAQGETAEQMLSVLGGYSIEELNAYLYSWVKQLPSTKTVKLELANSIWYRDEEDLQVKEEFLQTNVDYYDAAIYQGAFDGQTVEDINHWVQEKTDGMIPKLVDELSFEEMMLLINALAFDADWETPYKASDVYDDNFYALDCSKNDADFMRSEEAQFLADGHAIGFLRPYKDGNYSFDALLPQEEMTVGEYIATLDAKSFREMVKNPRSITVKARMPKFENEYSVELNSVLQTLGLTDAFTHKADFSKTAEMDLQIGQVLHMTYIEVNEAGTKAAAVSGVVESYSAAPESVSVQLDRPFVYFILDNQTNLPIFIGTVTSI